ncbi:hypothetical protein HYW42_00055 [Candidatus Daviesbacteria bacterium]|nr:hypothetical protein [Candidatus Daviesbacteria bacterium]
MNNSPESRPVSRRTFFKTSATAIGEATVLAFASASLVNAQTSGECRVRVLPRAQYYKDNGGATLPDGRPQFQPNQDQVLGPASGRRILIEAKPESKVVTTNERGEGIDPATNRNYVELMASALPGERRAGIRLQDLQNGDSASTIISCGNQKDEMLMVWDPKQSSPSGTPQPVPTVQLSTTPRPTQAGTPRETPVASSTRIPSKPESTPQVPGYGTVEVSKKEEFLWLPAAILGSGLMIGLGFLLGRRNEIARRNNP